ncbi:MAG: SDR family oxidoreductase [Chloroflexi bacterium]|nr:SDR family oxidoreductase [Chloroflexota bacterium]
MRVLVTGATGYIGSKLVPLLVNEGHTVRVAARNPDALLARSWVRDVDVVQADLASNKSLVLALNGIDVAFYLVHSMGSGAGFHKRDRAMAQQFAIQARAAGVRRIIYLGALGHASAGLTEHLASRHETGVLLASSGLDVVELRAGPVVGAGSLPFEMIRYLTERVPIMVCPRWVFTKVQPIGLHDVLAYLFASLDVPAQGHEIIEIGGSEVVSYGEMMTKYANIRGLRRAMIWVPVLTPRLSSLWVHLITPLRGSFARPIVEGLRNEVVVRDTRARHLFPEVEPQSYAASVQEALNELVPPREPALDCVGTELVTELRDREGLIRERRRIVVNAPQSAVFDAFQSLGGKRGWYLDWGWRLRGAVDRMWGGPGLRHSRPDRPLVTGDQLDFWRVEAVQPGEHLLLRAEMKLPGVAWLEFTASPCEAGATLLTQSSYFSPKGLSGVLYWQALLPIHRIVFNGLIRRVAGIALRSSEHV